MIFIWFACVVAAMGPARVAPPPGPPCTPSGYFQRFQMAAVRWVRSVCSGASSRRLMVSFRVAQCPSKVRLDLETTRKMVQSAGLYLFGHKPETISREITLPALQLSDIKNSGVEFLYLPRMACLEFHQGYWEQR